MTYTITEAHADGRHASTHPDDRGFWIKAGCADCAVTLRTIQHRCPHAITILAFRDINFAGRGVRLACGCTAMLTADEVAYLRGDSRERVEA